MATGRPFWKWHIWKSIGFFPYTLLMCYWSLDLIFKAKQKSKCGTRKIQDGRQEAFLKVTSLKINRLLPMATNNMHMKFEIEIPEQTWVTLRKQCRVQTEWQTDRRFQYTPPPPTSLGGGIKTINPLLLLYCCPLHSDSMVILSTELKHRRVHRCRTALKYMADSSFAPNQWDGVILWPRISLAGRKTRISPEILHTQLH